MPGARLPGSAPAALRDFVACRIDRVDVELSAMDWVPKPAGMDSVPTPTVSITDGWTSSSATINVGYGFLSIDLPATIVDGRLHVDTSDLSIGGIDTEIDKWVDAFNETMRDNGKQLDSFDVRDGRVTMTKRAIPPEAETGQTGVAPVTTAAPSGAGEPDAEPERTKPGWGCFAWLAAGIAAIAAAIGLVIANTGDDDKVTTGAQPTAVATSTTTSTTSTSTTIAEVGQATPPEVEPATRVCGVVPGDFPVDGTSGEFVVFEDPGPCAPGPGSYATGSCDPLFLPCATSPSPPFFVPGGGPGIDHTQSVPDAITDEIGASLAEFASYIRLFLGDEQADAFLRLSSDCGGTIVTGEAPVTNGAINIVRQPLRSYGMCTVVDAAITYTSPAAEETFSRELAQTLGLAYTVGPEEPDAELPGGLDSFVPSSDRYTLEDNWSFASRTVTQTLGAAPFSDDCLWFFPPDSVNTELLVKVLDGCQFTDHFWVFAAGTTTAEIVLENQDTIVGHGAAFANPLGAVPPSAGDPFAGLPPLPVDAVFPCGPGDVAFAVCPTGAPPLDANVFVSVSAAMIETIPIEPDGTERHHIIDFGPDGGPSFTVSQDEIGWSITSSDGESRAQGLIRDNSLTLLVPQDELPTGPLSYQWITTVDGQTVSQPTVSVVGLIATRPASVGETPAPVDVAGEPSETLESFYSRLSASIASGDLGFALDRLDPLVFEAYPTECSAALEAFADPDFNIEVVSDNGPEPWVWDVPDGRSFDVPDAISVTVALSGRGQSGVESMAHVRLSGGDYYWFTFCD